MADDSPESPQRWTAKQRVSLILSILKGETSAQAAARKDGPTMAEVEEWRDPFLLGGENALRAPRRSIASARSEQLFARQELYEALPHPASGHPAARPLTSRRANARPAPAPLAPRARGPGPPGCAVCSISMSSPARAVAAGCGSSPRWRTRPWWARSSRTWACSTQRTLRGRPRRRPTCALLPPPISNPSPDSALDSPPADRSLTARRSPTQDRR
jgi:hypothetical protein